MTRYFIRWTDDGKLTVVRLKGDFDSEFPKQFNSVSHRVIFSDDLNIDIKDSDERYHWARGIDQKSVFRSIFFGE